MPWQPSDAPRFTKKARTAALRKVWAEVANATLERTDGNDGLAVREANGVVSRRSANDHHLRPKD